MEAIIVLAWFSIFSLSFQSLSSNCERSGITQQGIDFSAGFGSLLAEVLFYKSNQKQQRHERTWHARGQEQKAWQQKQEYKEQPCTKEQGE